MIEKISSFVSLELVEIVQTKYLYQAPCPKRFINTSIHRAYKETKSKPVPRNFVYFRKIDLEMCRFNL